MLIWLRWLHLLNWILLILTHIPVWFELDLLWLWVWSLGIVDIWLGIAHVFIIEIIFLLILLLLLNILPNIGDTLQYSKCVVSLRLFLSAGPRITHSKLLWSLSKNWWLILLLHNVLIGLGANIGQRWRSHVISDVHSFLLIRLI